VELAIIINVECYYGVRMSDAEFLVEGETLYTGVQKKKEAQ
jgi:hypothetical protein